MFDRKCSCFGGVSTVRFARHFLQTRQTSSGHEDLRGSCRCFSNFLKQLEGAALIPTQAVAGSSAAGIADNGSPFHPHLSTHG
jgi:hypothetical protein